MRHWAAAAETIRQTANSPGYPAASRFGEVSQQPGDKIDVTVPHSARIWNYWLGGKDNYQVDREVGDQVAELYPGIRQTARLSRALQSRVISYLVTEAGIRQFLDVGTGLPTANNTHQVAQQIAPESRIVYVDNDPMVLVHARALLTSSPQGSCDYIEADLRDTAAVLAGARRTLDFTRPAAVLLLAVLHFVPEADDPTAIVAALSRQLTRGSYVAISHLTADFAPGPV